MACSRNVILKQSTIKEASSLAFFKKMKANDFFCQKKWKKQAQGTFFFHCCLLLGYKKKKKKKTAKEVPSSCLSVVVKVYIEEARFCTKAVILIMNER